MLGINIFQGNFFGNLEITLKILLFYFSTIFLKLLQKFHYQYFNIFNAGFFFWKIKIKLQMFFKSYNFQLLII